MIVFILIAIYLLSAYGFWKCINISHNKYGRWEILAPNFIDFMMVFMPLGNTIWLMLEVLNRSFKLQDVTYLDRVQKQRSKYDKFFRIRN